jgi:DNA-binding NarL/FixJ family response regulator
LAIKDRETALSLEGIVQSIGGSLVGSAPNGEDAARMILREVTDVLICDIVLPGIDALGMLGRIADARAATLPAMIVLSFSGMEAQESRLLSGARIACFKSRSQPKR